MFSTDPMVYGAGVDLRASAARIEADLHPLVTALADWIRPPFTPARRRAILAALAAAQGQVTRLGQLVNRYTVETRDPFHARGDFLRLSRSLGVWQECADHLHRVIRQRPLPLLPARPPADSMETAALDRLFEHLHLALSPKAPVLLVDGQHGNIPLPMTRFLDLIRAAGRLLRAMDRPAPWSFVDVGCGLGLKLLAAQELFQTLTGIELDAATARSARRLLSTARRNRARAEASPTPWLTGALPPARTTIHHGNALDFGGYGAFDVIYAYRPIADAAARHRLEQRMVAEARPGALLILPYPGDLAQGCLRLDEGLYWKPVRGMDAATLLRRAGHIGPLHPAPAAAPQGDEAFAAPLARVLRHWGHMP